MKAISEGVKKAVFVENNPNAIQCIMENLKKTQLEDQAEVIREDVFSALRRLDGREKFDYVFMDPPYNHMLEKRGAYLSCKIRLAGKGCTDHCGSIFGD